ncbi:MAG: MBL fold metallo-hydrolase [Solirubrobacteraceae bacterium]|nr:MBL fold metallo-hydrolase [Solirubrobacteraceae bacterium]
MAATHQWQAVGEGLHAWIHPIGDWGWSNAGLITGGGEALLVDTQWDERRTRDMLAIAPVPIGERITRLVLTHGDGDHVWGNRAVGADEIIASTATADHLHSEDPGGFARSARLLAAVSKAPIPPLPGPAGRARELGRFARYMTRMTAPWAYGEVRRTGPTRTFDGVLELEVGGRAVRLVDVGSAHSPGDTYVHLPAEQVVFAGDLLFVGVAPVMWIGPVRGWIAALDELRALEPKTVVPGHGPIAGPGELGLLRDYWEWAIGIGADGRNAKLSPAETALQAILDTEHEALPWGSWWSPERLVISLTAMEREAQGRSPIHSLVDRARVMAATAGVAEALRNEGLATTSFGPPA